MHIAIGLPNAIPSTSPDLLLEWARRADEGPFSSIAVLDRYAYDSYEPFTVLAAAAGVTKRVRLATTIIIAPLHSGAFLAKAAATIDALSGGRMVLGLAVGARGDDYEVTKTAYGSRGRRFTEQLAEVRSLWENETIGPRPGRAGGPEILIGGLSDQAFARVARYANGYVHGGGPPRVFSRAAEKACAAWADAGRPGRPQLWGQGYFCLGSSADAQAGTAYLRDYYAFTGPFAEKIASGLLTTAQSVVQYVRGYEEAGCDELVLLPTVARMDQLQGLAEVLATP